MNLHELLDAIDETGAIDEPAPGALRITGPAHLRQKPEIRRAVIVNKALLILHIRARGTNHALGFCTICDKASLVAVTTTTAPRKAWPACRMTPGCEGRHIPRPTDLAQASTRPTPAQPSAPPSPNRRRLLGPMPTWPARSGST